MDGEHGVGCSLQTGPMAPVKTVLRKVKEQLCIGMRAGSNLGKMRKDKSREAEVSGNLQRCYIT